MRATCLYVATKLGDRMDEIVVVGGLAPSLLVDQGALPAGADAHVGTMDLDIGLDLAMLQGGRYRTLTERLRRAGFAPDVNKEGNPTRQRWKIEGSGGSVAVDFLVPPSREGDEGGRLRDIERDFAAIVAPGLRLAFRKRVRVRLSGATILGERATRDAWVCGAGVDDVAADLGPLLGEPETQEALDVLRRDFLAHDALGPRRRAEFILGAPDDAIQADVVGFVTRLLEACGGGSTPRGH